MKRIIAVSLYLLFSVGTEAAAKGADDPCRPWPECNKEPIPALLPTPVPPLWMEGRCDRCNDIPVDLHTMVCPLGQVPICETRASFPPIAQCPKVTYGVCADAPIEGTLIPKFQLLFVAYSPPGRNSSVTYATGTTIGSSVSMGQSWTNATDIEVMVGADVIVASGSIKVNGNATVGGKTTNQEDVAVQVSESMRIPGQGDLINHDYDQIWFMVKPAIKVRVQERAGPPYPVAIEVAWQYEDGQKATTFWVYAGELLGTLEMPPEVSAQLVEWGFTAEDYTTLLSADPLVYPTSVIQLDGNGHPIIVMPAGGDLSNNFDSARFELLQILPYRPLARPNEQPTVINYTMQQSKTSMVNVETTQNYSVGVEYSASINFIAKARWRMGDKFTFGVSTSNKLSNGSSTTDTLTLGQPGFGYGGPVVLYVYEDKLWHTYAFRLE